MDTRIPDYLFKEFGVVGLVLLALGIALFKLSSDLAKLRTDLRQQTARDLLTKRFESYSKLWSNLRPLAIYADDPLTSAKVDKLSEALSDWYFSTDGGLYLTERCREFYFALQDVANSVEDLRAWKCERRPARPDKLFEDFVRDVASKGRRSEPSKQPESTDNEAWRELGRNIADRLKQPESIETHAWRDLCRALGQELRAMTGEAIERQGDVIFSVVQQVSSVLRSNLARELHSRLELSIPRP